MTKIPYFFICLFEVGTLIVKSQNRSFLVADVIIGNETLILVRDDGGLFKPSFRNMFNWSLDFKKDLQIYSPKGIELDLTDLKSFSGRRV